MNSSILSLILIGSQLELQNKMAKCLLIVDVQKGFINESTAHIPKLVEQIQCKYDFLYATRFFNKKNSFYRSLIKWTRFDINSEDFVLAFSPLPHVKIIDKSIYTCVNETFLQQLTDNDIYEVHICGIDTNICVTKCAVDLFEAGVVPKVLANFSASHAGNDAHLNALKTLGRFIGIDQVVF